MSSLFEMVKEIQQYSLDILIDVKRVCEENDIKFYLSEGTLLGAVRHNGFIPWDDDVDIMMFREDYEKFVKIAPKALNSKYILQHHTTTKNYWSYQAKVRFKGKCKFMQSKAGHLTENIGPYIDVFPIDYLPKIFSQEQYKQRRKQRKYRSMLFLKTKYSKPKTLRGYYRKFLSYFINYQALVDKMNAGAQRWNSGKHKYAINYGSYYNLQQQTIPVIAYGEPEYVDFEGQPMPIPAKWDFILTAIYGDYMALPPAKKRTPRHPWNYEELGPFNDATEDRTPLSAIRDMQTIRLGIIKDFDELCRDNDIIYYLTDRMLVGAVKNKGFLPEYDSVDLLMPRHEFERFLNIIPKTVDDKYIVQYSTTIDRYWSKAIKFRLLDNEGFTESQIAHLTEDNGPFINIFPLDSTRSSKGIKHKLRIKKINFFRRMLSIKLGVKVTKGIKRKLLYRLSKLFSVEKIHKILDNSATSDSRDDNPMWINYFSLNPPKGRVYRREYYGAPKYVKFENIELPIPAAADKMI